MSEPLVTGPWQVAEVQDRGHGVVQVMLLPAAAPPGAREIHMPTLLTTADPALRSAFAAGERYILTIERMGEREELL